jgi:hypothetical protein
MTKTQKPDGPTALRWVGRLGGAFIPGWPAADHEEPDPEVAAAKLASGQYLPADRGKEVQDHAGEGAEEVTNGN